MLGRAALGSALTASFILQPAPSLRKAYTSERVSGISAATWLLILGVPAIHVPIATWPT